MRPRSVASFFAPVALVLLAAGCASEQKKYENDLRRQAELIDKLTADNERLHSENENMKRSLAAAQEQARAAQSEAADLRRRLDVGGTRSSSGGAPRAGPRGTKSVSPERRQTRFTLESKVLFAVGKSELSPEGQRALRRVASIIKSEFPDRYIRIEGHTDNWPIKSVPGKTNMELSNERAEAVYHFLVNQCGLDASKLYTAGYSQFRPRASNRTEQGREMNRRVEIVVVDE